MQDNEYLPTFPMSRAAASPRRRRRPLLALALLAGAARSPAPAGAACSSCLVSLAGGGAAAASSAAPGRGGWRKAGGTCGGPAAAGAGPLPGPALAFLAARRLALGGLTRLSVGEGSGGGEAAADPPPPPASLDGEEAIETPEDRGVDPDFVARNREGGEGPVSGSMTAAIGIYKGWISPLLPPACRFLPTCSQYGVQAIQEFGPTRGALLTAWRLLRCSPLGGKGYDPPRWPPVAYTYSSY